MKNINTVGVVGAGTMGSALAQKFAQENFIVILADKDKKFVQAGLNRIKDTLNQAVDRKLFTAEEVKTIIDRIHPTDNLTDLKNCELVVEAIYEDFNAKSKLFEELSLILNPDTIVATNTSSFSVTELAKFISNPSRFIGMHYFYHAAKNRLVEIIPCEKTSSEVYEAMKIFSFKSGKDAITTKDKYGFAVNRFFVPWLNEAVRLLEEDISDISTIDFVCKKLFGIGMGPFALMNATGVKIAYHAQKTLEKLGPFYTTSPLLKTQAESNKDWQFDELPTGSQVNPALENKIAERMLGCVFFVCSQILEENICSAAELNRGARIGLRWRFGPVDLMRKYGERQVRQLVGAIANLYGEKSPAVKNNFWNIDYVNLKKCNNLALIELARPEDLNALNEDVMNQLNKKFSDADLDDSIDTIIIYGLGKAFVAGADIKFFVKNIKNNTIFNIQNFTKFGQDVFNKIDQSNKTVIAVLNGLALGGGLELALCADVIFALPKAQIAFPETGIGIYPGLGGTQRTAKKIGKDLAKYLIFTGSMLNADDAYSIGVVDKIISADEFFEFLQGNLNVTEINKSFHIKGKQWQPVAEFFKLNKTEEILNDKINLGSLEKEKADKICKSIKRKAPLALKIAERLIDEAKGCEEELKELNYIFSTNDALLGLTSIGKKIEFSGS